MNTSTMPYRISIDDIKQIMILTNELNNSNYPANPHKSDFVSVMEHAQVIVMVVVSHALTIDNY